MQRKTAKDILAESFTELAGTIPMDKIRVSDIVTNCGYSTATFYRHFRDKYDLMAWAYVKQCFAFIDQEVPGNYDLIKFIRKSVEYLQQQKQYVQNLVTHTSGQDSFIRYMTEAHCNIVRQCIRNTSSLKEIDDKTNMYIRIFCLGTTFTAIEWFYGKFKYSVDELVDLFKNSIPMPLRPYFDL